MVSTRSGRVRVVNKARDQKILECHKLDKDGKPEKDDNGKIIKDRVILGSTDDEGIADVPQPEVPMEASRWANFMKVPAIAGYVEKGEIVVYGAQ